jgi:WD40 repeat protein
MLWPTATDYSDVLQHPGQSFRDPHLQASTVETNALGLPRVRSGAAGLVYQLTQDGVSTAVKVFLFPDPERAERYAAVARHLRSVRLPWIVPFRYDEQGLRIGGQWYPILVMEWVNGLNLDEWLRRTVLERDAKKVRALADLWPRVIAGLRENRIAHGDLTHNNVLVAGNSPVLVDYDTMVVPELVGRRASFLGTRPYFHPGHERQPLSLSADDFSAWIIWLALRGIAADLALWQHYVEAVSNDSLLFTERDIAEPHDSAVWLDLCASPDPEVRAWAPAIRDAAAGPLERVPTFDPDPLVPLRAACQAEPLQWDAIRALAERLGNQRLPPDVAAVVDAVRRRQPLADALRTAIERADRGQGEEQAVLDCAARLPPDYIPALAGRIDAARQRVAATGDLKRALAATPQSDRAIADAWERLNAAGPAPGDPGLRARCELAVRRRDCLDNLAAILDSLSADEQDLSWLRAWDTSLLNACADADPHRERHRLAEERRRAWRVLEQVLDARDLDRVREAASHPLLGDYPPARRRRREIEALVRRAERRQQIVARLTEGGAEPLGGDDLEFVRENSGLFEPYRQQIEGPLRDWLTSRAWLAAATPPWQHEPDGAGVTVRWTWPHAARISSCLVATDAGRFLTAPEEAREGVAELTPHEHQRGRGGLRLPAPPEGGRLFVTVWPAIDLGWTPLVGPPLHLGPVPARAERQEPVVKKSAGIRWVTLSGHSAEVRSVAFHPEGHRLVSGSADTTVLVWDVQTRRVVQGIQGPKAPVNAVAYSPHGGLIASAPGGRSLRLWDADTGRESARLRGHAEEILALAFSPEGLFLAGACRDETVWLWHGTRSPEVGDWGVVTRDAWRRLEGHGGWVLSVAFSPDGRFLAAGSRYRGVQLWDHRTGAELARGLRETPVAGLAFSPDGSRLAGACHDRTITVWDAARWQPVPGKDRGGIADVPRLAEVLRLRGHQDRVECVAYAPHGDLIASGSQDGTVRLWDARTGSERALRGGHKGAVRSVAFSPDGLRLASASDDGTIRLWDVSAVTPETPPPPLTTHAWHLTLDAPPARLAVGETLTLALRIGPSPQPGSAPLRVPVTALELTAFAEAPGFHLEGSDTRTVAVVHGRPAETEVTFRLTPLASGRREVRILACPGRRVEGVEPAELRHPVEVVAPAAGVRVRELIDRRAVPDPPPDVLLYAAREETRDGERLAYHVSCPALGLHGERLEPPLPLTSRDAAGLRRAAVLAACDAAGASPPDARDALRAFGGFLFDRLVPPGHPLRKLYWEVYPRAGVSDRPWSWLVLSDAEVLLPWEMVCPYLVRPDTGEVWHDAFLAEKFVLAHGVGRRGLSLPAEAPLARLDLAHYGQRPDELPRWRAALGGEALVEVEAGDGQLALASPGPCYGLQVLRYVEERRPGSIAAARDEPAARDRGEAERMVRGRRVDFKLKRPVIALSFVEARPPARAGGADESDTRLEAGWVLSFLHAGASAVVGPRWPVRREAEEVFARSFHEAARAGAALGWAVWQARARVRALFPDGPDWLAPAYFGHPGCQPYEVEPARGFTFFEAINHPADAPFVAGRPYRFRASYRLEAPVWYEGRLRSPAASALQAGDVSVLVAPLSGGGAPQTHRLTPAEEGGDCQCEVTLTMPAEEGTWPVMVRFRKGAEELQTLFLELEVARP